jgi:hypothetical protein
VSGVPASVEDEEAHLQLLNRGLEVFLVACDDGHVRALLSKEDRKRQAEPGATTGNVAMLQKVGPPFSTTSNWVRKAYLALWIPCSPAKTRHCGDG